MKKLLITTLITGMGLVYGINYSGILEFDPYKNRRNTELANIMEMQSGILSGELDINNLEATTAGINCDNPEFGKDFADIIYATEKNGENSRVAFNCSDESTIIYGFSEDGIYFRNIYEDFDQKIKDSLEKKLDIAKYCSQEQPDKIKSNYDILLNY